MGMGISSISSGMSYDAASMFKKLDTDSSGGISKEEFIAAGKDKNDPNAEKIFDEIDTDGDGIISETENETALEKMSQNPPPPPPTSSTSTSSSSSSTSTSSSSSDTTYDEMDLNQDGTVTTEEKMQYIMQMMEENESIDTTEYTYDQFGQADSSTSGTVNTFKISA